MAEATAEGTAVTNPTQNTEERWRQIMRQLGDLGYSRDQIDAIPTEEEAQQIIRDRTPPHKANGHAAEQSQGSNGVDPSEHQAPPLQAGGDVAEADFDEGAYDLPIADPAAARVANNAVKAMRYGSGDKYKTIEEASRQIDHTQGDAIDYIFEVATENLGLDPKEVQDALSRGQQLREQDRAAGRLGKGQAGKDDGTDNGFLAYWHGDVAVDASRPWLVYGTIAEVGSGLWSGQWGTHKTFGALDLAVAAMTGTPIFGSEIDRRGGVLFYAAEGENEVPIRIQAAIENRFEDMEALPIDSKRAPFAWLTPEKLPLSLLDPKSVERYIAHAKRIDAAMRERYGVPLVLQILDTVVATAGYGKPGDENDPVIGKRLMREGLRRIGHETRSFALGVDHFGKEADTGTRGASSKEDNADTVLASLGTKDIAGTITNTRVAVRKVRGGVGGREYPYSVRQVPMGFDAKRRPQTTLVMDWAKTESRAAEPNRRHDTWGTGDGMITLRRALTNADVEKATKLRPWGIDGPEVAAFRVDDIRQEFYASYPAKGDTKEDRQGAKRQAWNRAVGKASRMSLIGCRAIDDVEWIWLGGKPEAPEDPKK
jgi:hypothetical protein